MREDVENRLERIERKMNSGKEILVFGWIGCSTEPITPEEMEEVK
jgi:hypothetical protein